MKKQTKKGNASKDTTSTKPLRKTQASGKRSPKNTGPDMRSTSDGKYDGGGYKPGDATW